MAIVVIVCVDVCGYYVIRGEEVVRLGLTERRVEDFDIEYGELIVAVDIVDSVDAAIRHIHQHGR